LIISFAVPNIFNGAGFLVLLFVGLAFLALFGSASTMNSNATYGGLYGFCWFLGLALCFLIGFWPGILLPVAATMLLGTFARPMRAGLGGFMATPQNQPPLYQQPSPQQETPGYQPYQQGYHGAPQQPSYQEGGQQYPYTPTSNQQYEQPQVQYPEQQQELPPMEQ